MADIKRFLDFEGLSKFWGIINSNFARKSDAVKEISLDATATNATLSYKYADGSNATPIVLNGASAEKAGLMSADHYTTITNLKNNVESFAPVAGVKIDGNEADIVDRFVDLKLDYKTEADGKTYISLVGGDDAVSKVDVTELVKTGLLSASDVIVSDGKTYLSLTFKVWENGAESTKTELINVSDLVDLYKAGDGLEISYENDAIDDTKTTGTITLKTATGSTLGGIKIGYESADARKYALELDKDGKAFVEVPWKEVVVKAGDTDGYVTVNVADAVETTDANGNPTKTYTINVSANDTLKTVESLAKTSVQAVDGETDFVVSTKTDMGTDKGVKYGISLADSVKDSLTFADSAVQTVSNGDGIKVEISNEAAKGGKSYAISLNDTTKTSLGLADSAVQEITILGTKLTKTANTYTVEAAKTALALGTASNSNVTTDDTLTTQTSTVVGAAADTATVPTTLAVKTYVDKVVGAASGDSTTAIKNAIESLDSSVSVGTTKNEATEATDAQMVFTKIEIVDGKLDDTKCVKTALKVKDITDFRAITEAEIIALCEL